MYVYLYPYITIILFILLRLSRHRLEIYTRCKQKALLLPNAFSRWKWGWISKNRRTVLEQVLYILAIHVLSSVWLTGIQYTL